MGHNYHCGRIWHFSKQLCVPQANQDNVSRLDPCDVSNRLGNQYDITDGILLSTADAVGTFLSPSRPGSFMSQIRSCCKILLADPASDRQS